MINIFEKNLNEIHAEKVQSFLDYFMSHLRIKHNSQIYCPYKVITNDKKEWVPTIKDYFINEEGVTIDAEWIITQDSEKKFTNIKLTANIKKNKKYLLGQANEFLNKVLFAMMEDTKEIFFRRSYLCFINQLNLKGELWLNSNLRIAPLFPEDNEVYPEAERVLVIDQNIRAVDALHAYQIAEEEVALLSSQLSFIFNMDIYKPVREERWATFRCEKTGEVSCKRIPLGFNNPNLPNCMPDQGTHGNQWKPNQSIFEFQRSGRFTFPKETRKILNSLTDLEPCIKNAFDNCCKLYHIGLKLKKNSPTAMISYMYGAIDSLSKNLKSEKNGFSNFMRKYNHEITEQDLNFIHEKVRSSHWHSGSFILGDYGSPFKNFGFDFDYFQNIQNTRSYNKALRTAILNWLSIDVLKKLK